MDLGIQRQSLQDFLVIGGPYAENARRPFKQANLILTAAGVSHIEVAVVVPIRRKPFGQIDEGTASGGKQQRTVNGQP